MLKKMDEKFQSQVDREKERKRKFYDFISFHIFIIMRFKMFHIFYHIKIKNLCPQRNQLMNGNHSFNGKQELD